MYNDNDLETGIVDVDYELISQDIDDVDLYAERTIEDECDDELANSLNYE